MGESCNDRGITEGACGNCRAWRSITEPRRPFTKADAAAQPKNLTSLESCIRVAILDLLDGRDEDPGPWFFFENASEGGCTTETEANKERLDFADAVVVRLREITYEPKQTACQKCGKVGGRHINFKLDLILTRRWYVPYCLDAVIEALRVATPVQQPRSSIAPWINYLAAQQRDYWARRDALADKEKRANVRAIRECLGCGTAHAGQQGFADRHDEQCKAEHASDHQVPLDNGMTAIVDERDHWQDDPAYPIEDWQLEVSNDDTRLGYLAWVAHQRVVNEEFAELEARTDPAKAHLAAAKAWELTCVVLAESKEPHLPEDCGVCTATTKAAQEATGMANEATKAAEPNPKAFDHTTAALLAASMMMPAEAAQAHWKAAAAYTGAVVDSMGEMSAAQVNLLKTLPTSDTQELLEQRAEYNLDVALEGLIAKGLIVDKTSVDR